MRRPVESQMGIFHYDKAGDWNRAFCHSNIKMCTIWYISQGATFLPSFNSIALLLAEIFLILCPTTVFAQPMMSSVTKFAQKKNLKISGTKKDITKRKTPFHSTLKSLSNQRIFGMTYFWIICTLTKLSRERIRSQVCVHFSINTHWLKSKLFNCYLCFT